MINKEQTNGTINILLADDDKDDRYFFEKALKTLSIKAQLTISEDGEKLMAYLLKHSEKLPDVLFLDLNMPRKNGAECLTEIKLHEKLKKLPVIIYSTSLHDDVADI
ncbi:MAG: response regulator, partial [Bacteroidia bacterium]